MPSETFEMLYRTSKSVVYFKWQKYAKEYIQRGQAEEEQEKEKRKQAIKQKILLRLELEQQMRDNAINRKVIPIALDGMQFSPTAVCHILGWNILIFVLS